MRLAMRMETSRYKSSVCALQISYHRSSAVKQSRLAPEIVSFNGRIHMNGENLDFPCVKVLNANLTHESSLLFTLNLHREMGKNGRV